MQLLHVLLASSLVAVVAAQSNRVDSAAWDPTARDWTEKCANMAKFAEDDDNKCALFDLCCVHDKLNGDRCQILDKTCEITSPGQIEFKCKFTNCTEMITTTTTTTTPAPRPVVNVAAGSSFLLLISALLPRFLF